MSKQYEDQPDLDNIHPPMKKKGPVECLGMKFENDEARREYFLNILREKLKDPEFRKIEGFPIGEDEDILALSDPPYYTACPNPFMKDFAKYHTELYEPDLPYIREPFAADTSAGKFDPIYRSHSYHTKVPYVAIQNYIGHYAEGSFCILDALSGTGMTGIAARKITIEDCFPRVILIDLSPEATFVASRMMTPTDTSSAIREHARIAEILEEQTHRLYEVYRGNSVGKVNYTVWSDVFICPECSKEVVFWDIAVDQSTGSIIPNLKCNHCKAVFTKRGIDPSFESYFDDILGRSIRHIKEVPVLINYSIGNKRFYRVPTEEDLKIIGRAKRANIPYPVPAERMPEGDESRRNDPAGITHVHHFYTRRMLIGLSIIFNELKSSSSRADLQFMLSRMLPRASRLNKWKKGQTTGITTGTLYIPSLRYEYNVNKMWDETVKYVSPVIEEHKSIPFIVSNQSATNLSNIPNNSIDYIFTDPPFGGNLNYSDLNFIWESWLRIWTARDEEAVVSRAQGKELQDYTDLMKQCMKSYHCVLKPGRWMTVVFHNSQNAVWAAIQEAILSAGFIVADVRTLDKKQKSFKQIQSFEVRFKLEAGTVDGVWSFVREHLKHIPVFVGQDGQAEIIAERQNFLLFDRMVAFHVHRGVTVPLSAAEFYAGLAQRFPERDGMYFLPEQAAEYDKKRMTVKEVLQLELFVSDEETAIQWLRQQLIKKPQTFQGIHPQFLREIGGWKRHEKPLELMEMLEENFLRYDGNSDVPSQIHSYLSTNFKDLRNLPKDDPALRAKAKDRWYVPDPNKAGDLERLRERSLLREFNDYRQSKQKRLRVFRLEAVRAGFKKAWQERDYKIIIDVARKIPENILQEDQKLLMWYDQALTRTEG